MQETNKNIERKKQYSQVCVWPGTLIESDKIQEFEEFMLKEFNTRIQYLETIVTYPDKKGGEVIEGTGGRHDVFFAVHDEDIANFSVPRLIAGIRWIEDVLSKHNYKCKIYPERVRQYKTWEA